MKRNLHAGRRRSGGLRLDVFTDDELSDIHLARSTCSSAPASTSRARRPRRSSPAPARASSATASSRSPATSSRRRSPTPSRLVCYGRDPKHDVVLEDGRVGFTNFGEGINVVDPYTGELRQTVKQDVADCSRIIDALPEIDVIERPLGAHDVPELRVRCTTPMPS